MESVKNNSSKNKAILFISTVQIGLTKKVILEFVDTFIGKLQLDFNRKCPQF